MQRHSRLLMLHQHVDDTLMSPGRKVKAMSIKPHFPSENPFSGILKGQARNFLFNPTEVNLNGSPFVITCNPNTIPQDKISTSRTVYTRQLIGRFLNQNKNHIFPQPPPHMLHSPLRPCLNKLLYTSLG